jgi:ribonuclease HI
MRQRVIPSDVHVGYASGLPLPRVDLPPCICGIARSFAAHEQVVLEYSSSRSRLPLTADLSAISDADFAKELSRQRAVFFVTLDGSRDITVECLAPLRSLAPSFTQPECIIVQDLAAETLSCQFAVFTVAFVRDCLRESCVEALGEACRRPQWKVSKSDLEVWFDLCSPSTTSPVSSQWVRGGSGKDGQSILLTTESRVQCKRPVIIPRAQLLLHPWQIEPPLPDLVRIDLINHHPQFLPSPKGWLVCKRNARVIITGPEHVAVGLDAAQYGMLADTTNQGVVPSESFMQHVVASCHSQERADEEYYVPWSRHLLACLRRILAVDFIVGTRAVASNPHYQHFFSPVETDSSLGASTDWPPQPALLLLDCFAPEDRPNILEQAAKHGHPVWVLRLDQPSRRAIVDIRKLQELRAQRVVDLPAKSLVHHNTQCWSAAQWDSQGSRYISQFWLLRPPSGSDVAYTDPNIVREQLGSWDNRRYDFHYNPDSSTHRLKSYRACQQDAVLYTGHGLFGGCDGSADRKHERMGAGAILTAGSTLDPILQISVPVGGPLASVRPEAVALLCLLQQIREKMDVPGRLTVFIDCLCLLQFLSKWGRANYWPGPKDIIHFDVLLPLLKTLRAWPREVVLLKVKSHSGCHHNEVADELAAVGASLGEPPSFAGPKKYGVLQLRIKPAVRDLISSEQARADLPQDIAPNKSILKKVVHVNTRRAVQLRTTIFARCLVRTEEGSTVARMISQQGSSEIRCWMQAMTGTYPVATYLHRIGRAQSRQCPFCSSGQDETLSHFLSVCSRFHDARTAAHNQIRSQLSVSLRESLPAGWQLFEETPMLATGLQLRRIPTAQVQDSGRPVSDADVVAGEMATGRWRPDFLAVSYSRSKIAIVEVCRPSDVRLERLDAAHQGKLAVYAPLLTALGFYIESGWAVQILPWVIGARGLIKKRNLCNALEFLEVPHRKQQSIIEGTVQTSIAALAFMHRTRFAARNTGPNQTSSSSKIDPTVFDLSGKGKRKAQNGPGDLGAIMMCWKRMTAASRRH